MAEIEFDVLFKVILLGDSGVGKTNILSRYTKNEFLFDSKTTIGVEFTSKIFNLKDHNVKIQIWDTAGQERYRSITNAYYRGSKGAIIIFDLSRRETFLHVERWYDDINKNADKDISVLLIGNKSDLENRAVSKNEAEHLAKNLNIAYIETSAYKSTNIEEAFSIMVDQIVNVYLKNIPDHSQFDDMREEKLASAINLNSNPEPDKKNGCC